MKTCKAWIKQDKGLTHLQGKKVGGQIKLERAADFLGVAYSNHRAAADAQLTAEVLVAIERDRRKQRAARAGNVDAWNAEVVARRNQRAEVLALKRKKPAKLKERPDSPPEDLVLRVRTADGRELSMPVFRSAAHLRRLARRVAERARAATQNPDLFEPLPLKINGVTERVVAVLSNQRELE
jgi:DNA polymerase III epsilon subunit-like protein